MYLTLGILSVCSLFTIITKVKKEHKKTARFFAVFLTSILAITLWHDRQAFVTVYNALVDRPIIIGFYAVYLIGLGSIFVPKDVNLDHSQDKTNDEY